MKKETWRQNKFKGLGKATKISLPTLNPEPARVWTFQTVKISWIIIIIERLIKHDILECESAQNSVHFLSQKSTAFCTIISIPQNFITSPWNFWLWKFLDILPIWLHQPRFWKNLWKYFRSSVISNPIISFYQEFYKIKLDVCKFTWTFGCNDIKTIWLGFRDMLNITFGNS